MFAGQAPPQNGGFLKSFLNYHLVREEEVIKSNLGRRSREKSGGEADLRRRRMEVFSAQLLNYHLERREEVIKINLGRRSPEKSGGEVGLHGLQAVYQVSLRLCGSG